MSVTVQSDQEPTTETEFKSKVRDNHSLSYKARTYAETEFQENYQTKLIGGEHPTQDDLFPDLELNFSKIIWETSTRAKRRHGLAKYRGDTTIIVLSEHTFENAGFEAIKETIRHELAHAFQNQYTAWDMNIKTGTVTYNKKNNDNTVTIDTEHTGSFKYFVEEWDLQGRCSSHYTKTREEYTYVRECPSCNTWWGNHRKCKAVRNTITGNRYCCNCEVYLYLVNPETGDSLGHYQHLQYESKETIHTLIDNFFTDENTELTKKPLSERKERPI